MNPTESSYSLPEKETLAEQDNNGLSSHSRMQINDTKAGMENIDKDRINSIIQKHSQSNLIIC